MARFWPTMGMGFLFAAFLGLVGYGMFMSSREAVIDPTGQWLGPWPLANATDCRTKILPDGRFELECRGSEAYIGLGTWTREVNHLTFKFARFVRDGEVEDPREIRLRIDGTRNTLCVGTLQDAGEPYCWKRPRL